MLPWEWIKWPGALRFLFVDSQDAHESIAAPDVRSHGLVLVSLPKRADSVSNRLREKKWQSLSEASRAFSLHAASLEKSIR